jgi:hypothetical protein
MSSGGAGDKGVCRMNRAAPLLELGLVATGSLSGFAGRLEEAEAVQQVRGSLPPLWSDAPLDLCDVDATRSEEVAIG